MARLVPILSALALGLQLGAQATQAPPKPAAARPAAPGAAAPKPQAAPAPKPSAQPAPAAGASSPVAVPSASSGADDLLTINATPYRPTLVRDPFATPTDAEQANRGDMVDDIAVKGRVVSNGKTMAVVSDARGNIRTLPLGYRFRDGVLVSIDDKAATFHQWDASSTNTKVFRTVVKIYKREEAKR